MFRRPRPADLIGVKVENRFEILSLVGEGGMANVYKAKHASTEEFVAIKILKRHYNFSPTDIERLKREARALNKLIHPNIVKAHSFGFLDSGEPYVVLDFLNGKSLDEFISKDNLPTLDWTLDVLVQICRGLDGAHKGGFIHRDLKPSNVMILNEPVDGISVKLLDFGTAKSSVSQPNELALTQKGIIFGSPFYISPEQIGGLTFDKRTDIYSFGCMMYEILTGKLPHIGNCDTNTLMKHLHDQPVSFSKISKRVIPYDVESVVFKCMDKDPDKRFAHASDVETALQRCLTSLRTKS